MTSLSLVIEPRGNGTFAARLAGGGAEMVSRTPFLTAARKLIELGYSPKVVLIMRRAGAEVDSLRSSIGTAAALTVEDGPDGRPRFRPWKAFGARPARKSSEGSRYPANLPARAPSVSRTPQRAPSASVVGHDVAGMRGRR
jgi:hypothetical protein